MSNFFGLFIKKKEKNCMDNLILINKKTIINLLIFFSSLMHLKIVKDINKLYKIVKF